MMNDVQPYTRAEHTLIRQASAGTYERQAWMIWIAVIIQIAVGLRFATLDPHSDYMILLGFSMALLAFMAVWFVRFKVRTLRLIRKLCSAPPALPR